MRTSTLRASTLRASTPRASTPRASVVRATLVGLVAALSLAGCDFKSSPDIKLEPPATNRAGAQTQSFVTYVSALITDKTNETGTPEPIGNVIFGGTQDPTAFADLFAE